MVTFCWKKKAWGLNHHKWGVGGSLLGMGRMVPKHIQRIDASVYRKMGGGIPCGPVVENPPCGTGDTQFMEQLSLVLLSPRS